MKLKPGSLHCTAQVIDLDLEVICEWQVQPAH